MRLVAFSAMSEAVEAEIDRLRATHAAELARYVDPSGPFVAHLREEVAYWRVQFERERQRAELAIDQCRVTHASVGPVSVPLRTERQEPPMNPIFSDPELAMMGHADGIMGSAP